MQCLPRVASVLHEERLIVGHGYLIEVYFHHKLMRTLPIFQRNGTNIYGIVSDKDGVYVFGEQQLAYVPNSALLHDEHETIRVKEFSDQIMTMKPLKPDEIAVLFTCNTTSLFHLTDQNLETLVLVTSVKSAYSCVLLKALLIGSTWEELYTVVGTVFGDILVSHPSKGGSILRKYVGHMGMVFGMLLFRSLLFTISDDRSLRVWEFSTIPSETPLKETACKYGHTARPFSICLGPNDTILTAGIDQTIYQWEYKDETLQMINSTLVGLGCIRNIMLYESRLYCGSENGGLISFSTDKTPSLHVIPTCNSLRSFARDGSKLYTINSQGHLHLNDSLLFDKLCLRFLTSSPSHEKNRCIVAYGDRAAVILQNDKHKLINQEKTRILSCICTENFAVVYSADRTAILHDNKNGREWTILFVEVLEKIGMKKPLTLSSILVYWRDKKLCVMLGSGFGHLLSVVVDEYNTKLIATTSTEINRHFKGEPILSMKKSGECLSYLVKNVGIVHWKLTEKDIHPVYIRTTAVSNTYDVDMPAAFIPIDHRYFIAGFHSTDFHMIDEKGLSVFRFNCAGGNRPWNCYIEQEQIIFEFLRKEQLFEVRQPLLPFSHHQESVHRSQIVFIHTLCSNKDSILFITGSNDTSMAFISVNKHTGQWSILRKIWEPSGFLCIHSVASENGRLLASGCGKGGIIIWEFIEEEFVSGNELGLYQKAVFRYTEDVRVLDLRFASQSLLAAALADGSIECFSITERKLSRIAAVSPPDLSLFTKVRWIVEEFPSLLAISTSGNLHLWLFKNGQFLQKTKILVASFGLSAIDVSLSSLIALGSESGEIFVYQKNKESIDFVQRTSYHSCTVTDVKIDGTSRIISLSLDCRLAAYTISENISAFSFAKSLAIWDPSSFIVEDSTVVTVGSGIHTLSL